MQDNQLMRFVNNLYDQGGRAPAGEPNGISEFDQELLVAKIIKSTPHFLLPTVGDLDHKRKLLDLVAAYLDTHDIDDMTAIVDYLVEITVEHYRDTIKLLFDGVDARSRG